MYDHLKLISFSLILISLIRHTTAEPQEIPNSQLTHITNLSFFEPTVLKLHNHLIYVSYPKVNSDVIIKLESKAIPSALNNTCRVVIAAPPERDYLAPEAKVLGNGKLVVGLIETAELGAGLTLRFFVIDLEKCAHHNFTAAFDDEMLQFYKPFAIIPYDEAFDVFAVSASRCQPAAGMCLVRFNLKGEHVHTLDFDFKTSETSFDLVKLSPLIEFEPNSGYAYVSTATSSVKVLNGNLRVRKQKRLPGYIRASSVLSNELGLCYHVDADSEPRTECVRYDQRLKLKARFEFANSARYASRRLYNLADGSSLLVSMARGKVDMSVTRLGADGRVSKPEAFRYDCESFLTEPADRFVELKGRNYCFSFQCKFSMITHCVALADAINLAIFGN